MITDNLNGYLILEHLSNIELYFTPKELITEKGIILREEEFHHSVNVMRNSTGDILFITDGEGNIFQSEIIKLKKKELLARIIEKKVYENKAENIFFCIPILKNPDRLKFAVEKCVELGITNFILFRSKYSLLKKVNLDKLQKTALSAMKQSLHSYLPKFSMLEFNDIIEQKGEKILFDQSSKKIFDGRIDLSSSVYFLFGPEGGFDENEINSVEQDSIYNLAANRLRSETAIIKCASLLYLK